MADTAGSRYRSETGDGDRRPYRTDQRLLRRVRRRLERHVSGLARVWTWVRSTYDLGVAPEALCRCLGKHVEVRAAEGAYFLERAELACAHRFDLLGAGPVRVRHGMSCRGVEGRRYDAGPPVCADARGDWLYRRINRANLREAQRIWSLVDDGYEPIDWQLDFKSGYRWSERVWYRDITYQSPPGADIKVPWELARLQHLPALGMAQALASQPGHATPIYAREFRNQVLDFIATNPPGFGVNWRCTMDVALRAVNMLVAYDLLRAAGADFDDGFERVFARGIHEHGRHIVTNLEWLEELHGNHYLANVTGLAFIAAYLPRSVRTDAWLAFAAQELVREVAHQFGADGANFEASVSYHRLSAEMVLFATALLTGLPPEKKQALTAYRASALRTRPRLGAPPLSLYRAPGESCTTPFPEWYWARLEKMAEFTMHMTRPDGRIAQFGDNDSGRFVKVSGAVRLSTPRALAARYHNLTGFHAADLETCIDEIDLDHHHLVAGMNAFFARDDLAAFAPPDSGTWLVNRLSGDARIASYRHGGETAAAAGVHVGTDADWQALTELRTCLPGGQCRTTAFPASGDDLREDLALFAYPDFGAYVFRAVRLFLVLRCGGVGQGGIGGHAHLDQLAPELVIDGQALVSDPGTYLYTPSPERRNAYRSARAHFVPRLRDREPGDLSLNLFRLGGRCEGECLYFGPHGFVGRHFGYGQAVYRTVTIERDRVVVHDFTEAGPAPDDPMPESLPFSPGYGKQCRA